MKLLYGGEGVGTGLDATALGSGVCRFEVCVVVGCSDGLDLGVG